MARVVSADTFGGKSSRGYIGEKKQD